MFFKEMNSPLGILRLTEENGALTRLEFEPEEASSGEIASTPLLDRAVRELEEYFGGTRREFGIPLRLDGTVFQLSVWNALKGIPYGKLVSYQEVAASIGFPRACRAVGSAIGKNPVPIFIPCHRVLGKNGSLTGYSGGLLRKEFLLGLENPIKR